jgi:hypothetical protein
MNTLSAIYRGARVVELCEEVVLPRDMKVFVVIPEQDDEVILRSQLQIAAEIAFARLWDNEEDDVWNEYL